MTPSQVGFAPDGGVLVVTERATNRITTFVLGPDGLPSGTHVYASAGTAPFRTGAGTIEGFRVNADGSLEKLAGQALLPAGTTGLAAR